ncbi:MAG TPA: AMP-binding protein, partial [Kiritimatiellia bacterium]
MNPFSRDAIEGSLPERFEVQVRRLPGQIALRSDGLEWTYQELNRCANRLARQFLPPTPAESLPVPLLIGHGALEIMALLAVLKSGRAYVALDPLTPLPRLRQILADVGTDLVLTCRAHADLAARLAPRVVELPGAAALQADARDDENLGVGIQPGALASLIYTSGSTGTPKGVMRSHRASMHRCWLFQQTHRADAGVCISHLFSVGFVAAEVDVYGALLNGATLCCYPVRERGIGPLAEWLAAEQITVFHPPTALFRRFLESLEQPLHLPKLRALCLAGEPVFRQDVERIHQRLPGCTIVHRFASSETSLLTQFILPPDESCPDAIVPVGVPAPDKTISLLNAHGCEVPAGEIGEIVVESHYLSPGYWRRPELTAEKFIPDQHGLIRYRTGDLGRFTAGRLYHLGRLDAQLKIRGYRVEPQEVEAALLGLGALKEAAVFGRPDAAGEMQLVGVVVPKVPETW